MKNFIPENLKFSKEHEWLESEGNETGIVGITDFAQKALGDIIYVELPEVGKKLSKGQAFGVVESIKSVSDLYSPIEGEVVAVNKTLVDSPELINQSPYDSWMVKIKTNNLNPGNLLDSQSYKNFCEEQH